MKKSFKLTSMLVLALLGVTGAGVSSASATEGHESHAPKHANIEGWTPSVKFSHCELLADHNPTHQGAEWTLASSTADTATYKVNAIPGWVLWSSGQEVANGVSVTVPASNKLPASCTKPEPTPTPTPTPKPAPAPKAIVPTIPKVTFADACTTHGSVILPVKLGHVSYSEPAIGEGPGGGMNKQPIKATLDSGFTLKNLPTGWLASSDGKSYYLAVSTLRGTPNGCTTPVIPAPPVTPPAPVVNVPVTVNNSNSNVTNNSNTNVNNNYNSSSSNAEANSSSSSEANATATATATATDSATTQITEQGSVDSSKTQTSGADVTCTAPAVAPLPASKVGISATTPQPITPALPVATEAAQNAPNVNSLALVGLFGLIILCLTAVAITKIAKTK